MEEFPFTHRETARFRDLDPMGHVNNSVYLTWIENALIEFMRRLGMFDQPHTGGMAMILARGDRVIANAQTVLVAYDYNRNESKEIPDEWRRRVAA